MKNLFPVTLLLISGLLRADASTVPQHRLGIAVGIPQTLSLTYQYSRTKDLSFEAYAGTVVIFSSLGGRLIYGNSTKGFHPRVFAGGLLLHNMGEYSYDPSGTALYLWTGGGFYWAFESQRIFLDLSHMATNTENKGMGTDLWVISGGLLFDL